MKSVIVFGVCIGAGVVGAVGLIALSARLTNEPTAAAQNVAMTPAPPSAMRQALQRCGLQAQPDEGCRELWAENRRHFLGLDRPSASSESQP